eukprot:CAMPEP_0172682836 /NCGR_PEP_ID=MMETSP1074-20121228/18437_1 /TAXON_ID=2916 /ORGANISM="Ceratium fusus, Strain PA161109" /LENGTH=475 /DNA_ID=CAMNT_0013501583 /DNA_START=99 /DNA_END=1526 /DNA_ORIENTATION=+
MTDHVQLKECQFLLHIGASPYAGDSCHLPPLLLLPLFPLRHAPALTQFTLIVAVDIAVAVLLRLLATQYASARVRAGKSWAEATVKVQKDENSKGPKPMDLTAATSTLQDVLSPAFIGLCYFLNPFVIASCLAHSLQNFHHLALCCALGLAGYGRAGLAAAALALAVYLFPPTPLVLFLPCAYLAFAQHEDLHCGKSTEDAGELQRSFVRSSSYAIADAGFLPYLLRFALAMAALLVCLYGASAATMGGDMQFLQASLVSVVAVRDLTPNVGIWWYIFIEVFDRYRILFLIAFHGHLLFYPVPLHVRIGRHRPTGPWLHAMASMSIVSLFKAYPTASDFALMLSTLLIPAELARESEHNFAFLLSGLLFGLCMAPTMAAVWLSRNAGNANFLYNMTLVVNVFGCLLVTEWLRSGLKLRRRERVGCFCREVLLDELDKALSARGAASVAPTESKVGDAGMRHEQPGDCDGIRQRRS